MGYDVNDVNLEHKLWRRLDDNQKAVIVSQIAVEIEDQNVVDYALFTAVCIDDDTLQEYIDYHGWVVKATPIADEIPINLGLVGDSLDIETDNRGFLQTDIQFKIGDRPYIIEVDPFQMFENLVENNYDINADANELKRMNDQGDWIEPFQDFVTRMQEVIDTIKAKIKTAS